MQGVETGLVGKSLTCHVRALHTTLKGSKEEEKGYMWGTMEGQVSIWNDQAGIWGRGNQAQIIQLNFKFSSELFDNQNQKGFMAIYIITMMKKEKALAGS